MKHLGRVEATTAVPAANGNGNATTSTGAERVVKLIRASTITPERVEWLWTDRLPLHDLAVLAGEPGLGKSTMTTELAARVTRGELEGKLSGDPRSVLIASAEDHFNSVVWGRLKAAGADLDRIHHVVVQNGDLTLPGDVNAIRWRLGELRGMKEPAALVSIDPIASYLSVQDGNSAVQVRQALTPLAAMAQEEHVCVLPVTHVNKGTATKLLDRLNGSGQFGAAPRSVLVFIRDPDDPDGERGYQRVIVHAKTNNGRYAESQAAHIAVADVPEVGTVSRLVIDGDTDLTPEDATRGRSDRESSAADVEERIGLALQAGERPALEVKEEVAEKCSASARTVERAAGRMEERGELEAVKRGFPARAFWRLHSSVTHSSDTAVATGPVATANPPQTKGLRAVPNPSSDTRSRLSLLDGSGPYAPDQNDDQEGPYAG
ncbi:MAG: AAA family ATPase [Solirubrobacterales bacterium]|nr:AAA family ATPase [Solirubrobacterales bacterium]